MDEGRVDIKTLDRAGLREHLECLGEPAYRVRQILRWLYARRVRTFEEMTDLSLDLRRGLSDRFSISALEAVETLTSEAGTRKYLWRLANGETIESVGMPAGRRLTVCFSTQAGCAMGCAFCATGRGGFVRDLTAGEIVDQVLEVGDDLGRRVTNAVAMGQGEPFANYEATLGALRLMNDPDLLGIGARHLTVSTCGMIGAIRRFASEPEQFTLAVSLHSAIQATRDRLMPAMSGQPLHDLRRALTDYAETTGRRPTLEYALIDGINDDEAHARALAEYCAGMLVHVNLIPWNPVPGTGMSAAAAAAVSMFTDRLTRGGTEVTVRRERGGDIDAACGQHRQRAEGARGTDTGHHPPAAGQSEHAAGS